MTSPRVPPPPAGSAPHRQRPPLRRGAHGRVVAGVCRGLADHLGLHPLALRVGFIALTAVGGVGALVYAFLWATVEPAEGAAPAGGDRSRWLRQPDTGSLLVLTGGLVILVGGLALVQAWGLDLRLDITVPVLVLTTGAVFVWSQLDTSGRDRLLAPHGGSRQQAMGRLVIGVGLAVAGLVALGAQGRSLGELRDVGVAVVITLAGVGLLAAPYVTRLWRDLREEQAATARETERADIAAHLHDSVLQTLALIQRRADDPVQVARLARAQERELRSWLYAGPVGPTATLAGAVAAAGHEVEDLHGVPIELIVTGDRPLDADGQALVNALREAMLNAVRHGAPPVSAYVEVGTGSVEAFVRDHGEGFDPEDVPADRLGVRESIMGRMQRHGGTARVRRLEQGTEVSLELPVSREPQGAES
ncbi:ATP-binding protein [Ornithinimicrobium cavernae]|uniref:ATP-binding protein n=1 Tax=Ornithinimicrobium cavernae TaxID=2666047 RepID=UPI001F35F193|nr:ATP-binding protein [Ornithinimicrobium cavernae]